MVRSRRILAALSAFPALAGAGAAQDVIGEFPVVQAPAGNPTTPERVRLGQALFFEEQLSSDDSMACATCHSLAAGGGEERPLARAPGEDGVFHTPDDEFGSPAMTLRDARGEPLDGPFGLERQVTSRNPPTVIGAAFFNTQFWDTRALPVFRDLDGEIVLSSHASLESQAVGPLISSTEMSWHGRTWDELTAKLAAARPLALASDLPEDLAGFVAGADTYEPLFESAFGTPGVSRERIAMALAAYERTLVPDQTPFDLGTMTPAQERGYELFLEHGACEICHVSKQGLFTDGARRTISLPDHERAVKTPTLRNAGLRTRYMSSGQFTSLSEVLAHYEGLDFIHFETPEDRAALIDFVGNALTDPRVAAGAPPFERPRLRSQAVPEEPHALEVADDSMLLEPEASGPAVELALTGDTGLGRVVLAPRAPWGLAAFSSRVAPAQGVLLALLTRDALDDGDAAIRVPVPTSLAQLGLRGEVRGWTGVSGALDLTESRAFEPAAAADDR